MQLQKQFKKNKTINRLKSTENAHHIKQGISEIIWGQTESIAIEKVEIHKQML